MGFPIDRQQLRWAWRLFGMVLAVGYLLWGPLKEMDLATKLLIIVPVILLPLYYTVSEIRDRL